MKWTLTLEKKQDNAINPDIAKKHLNQVLKSATRNQTLGFTGRKSKLSEPVLVQEGGAVKKRYTVNIRLEENKARNEDVAWERFEHVKTQMLKTAGKHGWTLVDPDMPLSVAATTQEGEDGILNDVPSIERAAFIPIDIDDQLMYEKFGDIYERDPHIRIINDAVQTYYVTDGEIRAHTILFGLPGGCKSSLVERLKTIYDDHLERLKIMDASTMTKAGLEKWILERAEAGLLPEIMAFEEIEKVDNKDNLKCLGSIMASGYMQRTNARIGNAQVPAKFLCLGTCNDAESLQAYMRGYIWDRFTNQVECTLPDDETMRKILLDKIKKIRNGKPEWADKAMKLAKDLGVRTPRKIIGYLAGRHRLDTGAYQRDWMAITDAGKKERESLATV